MHEGAQNRGGKKTDGEEINLEIWFYYLQWVGTCLERLDNSVGCTRMKWQGDKLPVIWNPD